MYTICIQVGRAVAGYTNYREGGVGPVVARVIPVAERALFKMYAATLLEGPPVEPALRMSLALVLLLHYDSVSDEYPNHRLVLEIQHTASRCSISNAMFSGWVTNTKHFNKESNTCGLTMHQV